MNDQPTDEQSAERAQPGKRRAAGLLVSVVLLAGAGVGSWQAATRIATGIETSTARQVREALNVEGQGWASVRTDGLNVRLSGTAPDEVARFRVLTTASGIVDDRRIIDEMQIAQRDMLDPPDFTLEVMRQGNDTSLIGLVPARTDRTALAQKLTSGDISVADLTSTAAFPAPDEWQPALDYAVRAAQMIDQGTISVTPGRVRIEANVHGPDDKTRLDAELRNSAPEDLATEITVTAPLPVIAPYLLRISRDAEGVAVLETCAADSAPARDTILSAAKAAGAGTDAECALGIGAPAGWVQAASAAIAALERLGAGTLEINDRSIRMTAAAEVAPDALTGEMNRLTSALPDGWTLSSAQAEPAPAEGPPTFTASIDSAGQGTISGVIPDPTMRETVQSLARAQLGPVEGELSVNPALRDGWALRVMAGLDAVGVIDEGLLEVTDQMIRLSGVSGDRVAPEKAIAALAARLGEGADYELAIAYDRFRDPTLELPSGASCVDRLNAVMLQSEIGFEPGGAIIAGNIEPVIEEMRPILAECGDYRMEIAGHTDAQGGDESNLQLSRARADSVLNALRNAGLAVQNMVAQGYGETRPIAENDTEEGREANRRIEVTLISPDPVRVPVASVPVIAGKTPSAEAAAETLRRAQPAEDAPEALSATDLTGERGIPDPMGDEVQILSSPPRIEPPATIQEATPDTPRPPDRPDDVSALNDETGTQPPPEEDAQ
ncbi:OmpA family protein [Paracoccus aurantiacus]|uniref:OmpA family protein n=1 Tax=Paracoccus aurantiacus TaxID=2599412 RepID=A0A5C6S829_9RHOB|nr:OmpA family protein [Paracoccus aurantiacus]TXB70528.1 OmpA family protein [Paracoccus aurantiacus]